LENVIFGDESSQFGQTMSTGSSVTHQQTMSFGQFDDLHEQDWGWTEELP